ncbi:hypothetical protein V6N13_010069 [Hibiscus sabdariffa]|uniref:Uncharacterized protein n=1 Tax=Hibiscus sabdariffa TaxID=183260 RepID=A0ABR2PRM7_9ROSI
MSSRERMVRVGMREGLKLCAHEGCGRPETRVNEFERSIGCWTKNYCSRSCHWSDWNLRNKAEGGGAGA